MNTFGVFQSYYEQTLLLGHSASSISWIGTVHGFLLLLAGVIVGPIFDKGYLRSLIAIGTFLVVFGLMMTSLSTQYYQVFLAHGLAVGLGPSCFFPASQLCLPTSQLGELSRRVSPHLEAVSVGMIPIAHGEYTLG